jgi:hypothetical protein
VSVAIKGFHGGATIPRDKNTVNSVVCAASSPEKSGV